MSNINQYIKSPISGIIRKISDLEKKTQKQIKRINRRIDNIKGPQGPQGPSNGNAGVPNAGVISFEPYLLEFGSLNPNTSKTLVVQLRNLSLSDIIVDSITTREDCPLTYSGIDFPATLSAGTSTPLNVTFTPTDVKPYYTHLYLYDTIKESPGLLGVGAISGNANINFTISPTSITYGDVAVGHQSSKTITIKNESLTENIIINNISTGSDTVTTTQTLPFTITSGKSKTVDFIFQPTDVANYFGTIQISDTQLNIKTSEWAGSGFSQFIQERMWDSEIVNPSGSHSRSYVVISQDGNTMVIGDNANTGSLNPYSGQNEYHGTLYIYTKGTGGWTLQTTIQLEAGTDDDFPIYSLSLSGDGNTLAASGIDGINTNNVWTIWMYNRSGSTWSLQQKIIDDDSTGTQFGLTILLSADGLTLAIGSGASYAWIYVLSGTWIKQYTFNTPFISSDSVALSSNGNTFIIGSSFDDSDIGSAFSYTRSGSSWSTATKIVMVDNKGNSHFGRSITLSPDGRLFAIGGPDDDNTLGAVLVYELSDSGWVFKQKLVGTGTITYPQQGNALSVSFSSDGSRLVVGGYMEENIIGAAWIWGKSGGVWSLVEKIRGMPNADRYYQGTTVAISGDNLTYAISTMITSGSNYNSVWIFY